MIEDLWVWLVEQEDGDEEIIAAPLQGLSYPLIAADMERVEQCRGVAEKYARESGRPVRLVHFARTVGAIEEVNL